MCFLSIKNYFKQRFSANEVLSQLFDTERDIEKNVSETEDNVEEGPDYEAFSSDENETLGVDPPVVSTTRSGHVIKTESYYGSSPHLNDKVDLVLLMSSKWFQAPPDTLSMDTTSAFELFISPSTENNVLVMTNLEGRQVYGDSWKDLDVTHLHAYIRLLILEGVYKSKGEATASLWNADAGSAIFPATMSLKTFHIFSCVIRFHDRETSCKQVYKQMYGTSVSSNYPFCTIQGPT